MMYTIHYTETASQDLNEAVDYIDHILFNPDAADRLLDKLEEELRHLEEHPEAHAIADDPFLKSHGIRFIVINNYLAFYTIDESRRLVHIIRFLYGKRDWISVLKNGISLR